MKTEILQAYVEGCVDEKSLFKRLEKAMKEESQLEEYELGADIPNLDINPDALKF
ncbi:MAG: hypothetical protein M0P12_04555 [Paludibacteraceae bacterium]|jgi:hypothetical protein|nr:hypothetical protein [Paludibacteraceae bacterium]MCK9615800.1 hypothetical protein [Candidatus Omnitrophota bacterium]